MNRSGPNYTACLVYGTRMGDRANIYVTEKRQNETGGIYFYSHGGGYGLPMVLQAALKRGEPRWTDPSYLTRIIASDLIDRTGIKGLTGMGISTFPGDNEYPLLVVETATQMVGVSEYPYTSSTSIKRWASYEAFIAMTEEQVLQFRGDMASLAEPAPALERLLRDDGGF